MKRTIQGGHPLRSSWKRSGLSGAVVQDYSGMSVGDLRSLIDRRAYAVTSGQATGIDADTLIDRLVWLDHVLLYARSVQSAGRAASGASSAEWTAFTTAISSGAAVSRRVTGSAATGSSTASSGGGSSGGSTSTSTSTSTASGKDWTDPGAVSDRADNKGGAGGGLLDSPFVLAGVVGVGVMLFALVAGKK